MMDKLRSYLDTVLPLELGAPQYLRLFRTVFLLVFASAVLLHLLLQDATQPLHMLIHAAFVSAAYTVVVSLACATVYAAQQAVHRIRVWQVWLASLLVFLIGYYLLPLDGWIPGAAAGAHTVDVRFLQLVPVWGLVTYFFVQPYLAESLRSELARLRDINAMLEAGATNPSAESQPIRFQSGKSGFVLEADSIRNIAVDDHYCYVHYRRNDNFAKRDLAMPLSQVLTLLPTQFVQVHRSHVVNLRTIRSIRRENRNVRLVLEGGLEVPVSRHRLTQFLPLLRQQLSLNK